MTPWCVAFEAIPSKKHFSYFQTTLVMMQMDALVTSKHFKMVFVPRKVTDFLFWSKKDGKFLFGVSAFPKISSFRHSLMEASIITLL